jgi:RNA polymerase-binding transcription factor DksA
MMTHLTETAFAYTEAQRAGWQAQAARQGLVCVVCGQTPKLERRHAFYDTGLCADCAGELAAESRPEGAA